MMGNSPEKEDLLPLQSAKVFFEVLDQSIKHPVIFFKHSTRCPISIFAKREYLLVAERQKHCQIIFTYLDIICYRKLSSIIASELGVRHKSPQVILVSGKKVLWQKSHCQITQSALLGVLRPYI